MARLVFSTPPRYAVFSCECPQSDTASIHPLFRFCKPPIIDRPYRLARCQFSSALRPPSPFQGRSSSIFPQFCEYSVTFSWCKQAIRRILSIKQRFAVEEVSFDAVNNLFQVWSALARRCSLLRELWRVPAIGKPAISRERGNDAGRRAAIGSRIRANPASATARAWRTCPGKCIGTRCVCFPVYPCASGPTPLSLCRGGWFWRWVSSGV